MKLPENLNFSGQHWPRLRGIFYKPFTVRAVPLSIDQIAWKRPHSQPSPGGAQTGPPSLSREAKMSFKKNEIEVLELKNTTAEMKTSLHGPDTILTTGKRRGVNSGT